MKKRTLILVLICILGLSACRTLGSVIQEPVFSIKSVDLGGISFAGVEMIGKVAVENPYSFDIPFPELDWELFINTNSFVRGVIKNDRVIKSNGVTVVDVPISLTYDGLYDSFQSLKNTRAAAYVLAMGAKFTVPILGEKTYHFEVSGELPLVKIPAIGFKGISLKSLSLQRVELELVWEIENQNNFSIAIDAFNFDFTVNNSSWARGIVQNTPTIRENTKALIPLTLTFNSLNMIREVTDMVSRGSGFAYICGGTMDFSGDLPGLRGLSLPFNFYGNSRLR
ncbi:MAG: LEA type 2 family protein [Spirochaetaceae bacterium]|jgi:LEA14-like dessication related protein|nr:LEA type 2 family protein [Spirochaetaceae bacterium]